MTVFVLPWKHGHFTRLEFYSISASQVLASIHFYPNDCQKYNENMKFLGIFFFFFLILFIIKYYLYFYNVYLEVQT